MIRRPDDRWRMLLAGLKHGSDGIWSGGAMPAGNQEAERKLREQVAAGHQGDYLENIARHHSIPVMDCEVERFLNGLPPDAVILDVGGCWGWHWRNLRERPEILVVIVDFVRANLHHAKNMLGPLVDSQVALVHADATDLPFHDALFDGFWTVQTFQHIANFRQACCEAYRVLKDGGRLANYSLHITPSVQLVYRLFGKRYHTEGMVRDLFHLARANDGQRETLAQVFGSPVTDRYTECLFHPDLKMTFSGRLGSRMGHLDSLLGEVPAVGRWLARQRSFETVKAVVGTR
ncbi:MAG: class I SAM-dependent methyltransferase [Pseudomonadota bacterium]